LSRLHDGKFTTYTPRQGLFDHGVFQILEDARGQFWMSCNRGIYRVSRRELNDFAAGLRSSITSVAYGKADGLLNPECNGGSQPSGWKTRDGRLWFPTQDGVAVINPNQVEINEWPPPVLIEEARLGSNPLAFSDVVEIPAGQDNLELHYAGLSFINPEKMKFKYKLEGLDNDWVEAGNRRTAYFSHLPPGEYTFRVVAANSDGVWNSVGAQIRVIVRPPFWRTWWFLLICAALLCGGLAFAYRRRISKLKRAHAAQEAFSRQLIASQENERKRIAAELHDGLGQNLLVIKNRALLGLKGNGDTEQAKRQLMEISDTSSQAIEEVREIAYALRPFHLDRLGLTKAIEAILKQVSASSEIEFTSRIDPIDNLFSKESEINLYRIVQESVNNIVKHSGASRARVEIERDARGVLISIRDNGHGFALDETASHKSRGDGLGLAGISERARILGGKHTVQTSVGEGTTVTIKIGLKGEPDGE
jgi:signal transduction histidine kinase